MRPSSLPAAVLRAARELPSMPRAACRARAPLHDLEVCGETSAERAARHRAAAWVCRTACLDVGRCAALVAHLPPRTEGVFAGWLLDGHHPPRPIAPDDEDEHEGNEPGEGRCNHDTEGARHREG